MTLPKEDVLIIATGGQGESRPRSRASPSVSMS
jgi:hypothetical protein